MKSLTYKTLNLGSQFYHSHFICVYLCLLFLLWENVYARIVLIFFAAPFVAACLLLRDRTHQQNNELARVSLNERPLLEMSLMLLWLSYVLAVMFCALIAFGGQNYYEQQASVAIMLMLSSALSILWYISGSRVTKGLVGKSLIKIFYICVPLLASLIYFYNVSLSKQEIIEVSDVPLALSSSMLVVNGLASVGSALFVAVCMLFLLMFLPAFEADEVKFLPDGVNYIAADATSAQPSPYSAYKIKCSMFPYFFICIFVVMGVLVWGGGQYRTIKQYVLSQAILKESRDSFSCGAQYLSVKDKQIINPRFMQVGINDFRMFTDLDAGYRVYKLVCDARAAEGYRYWPVRTRQQIINDKTVYDAIAALITAGQGTAVPVSAVTP